MITHKKAKSDYSIVTNKAPIFPKKSWWKMGGFMTRTAVGFLLAFTIIPTQAQTYYSEQRYATISNNALNTPPKVVKGSQKRKIYSQKSRARTSPSANNFSLSASKNLQPTLNYVATQTPNGLDSMSVHVQQGQEPCWDAAARYQNVRGLNPWLLYAVAYVESRHNPNAVGRNTNGSYDLGLMQINSTWFPTLRRYGIEPKLLTNACASTFVGAWVLAQSIHRYGFTWQAIAAYNVGSVESPRRRAIGYAYAKRVYAAYDLLTRRAGLVPGMQNGMTYNGERLDSSMIHSTGPNFSGHTGSHIATGLIAKKHSTAANISSRDRDISNQIPGITKPAEADEKSSAYLAALVAGQTKPSPK